MSFAYNDSLIGEWEASDAPLLLNHSDFRIEARGNASDMEAFQSPPHVYFVSPSTPLCGKTKSMTWTTVLTLVTVASLGAGLDLYFRKRRAKTDKREYENSQNECNSHITFQEWKKERDGERRKLPREERRWLRSRRGGSRNP
jgi:hypothetical protein